MEGYTAENKYVKTLSIPCYYTDASFRLKAASFMDLMQEMAYLAANELHFGYDDLQTHHTAWVLSRMHFSFENPPLWRDEIQIQTWHKGLDGLFFLRDFRVLDKEGKEALKATTSWIVINVETRRLVRSNDVLDMVPETTQCKDNAIAEPAGKVVMPKDVPAEKVAEHVVSYSDVDIIGHTNNARYMVWAMDCIDYSETSSRSVRDVVINFNRETKPGETVELYRARVENGGSVTYYIEGMVDGKSAFCIQIGF